MRKIFFQLILLLLALGCCITSPELLRLKFDSKLGYQAGSLSPFFLNCKACRDKERCFLGTCCRPQCENRCGGALDLCGGTCQGISHCKNQGPNGETAECKGGHCCSPNCTDKCGGAENGCGGKCDGLTLCHKNIARGSLEKPICRKQKCCITACHGKYAGAKDSCDGYCEGRPGRVLLFGDSMVNAGLQIFLKDLFKKENFQVWTYSWASLSTVGAASTPRYKRILGMHNPDIVFIILGSNELFIPYPEERRKYIEKLVKDTGSRSCYWIGPPTWKPDSGLVDVIAQSSAPCKFFDSGKLKLHRQDDKVHPDMKGGKTWSEEIWEWFNQNRP